ncbi:DUF1120 domain-containing protein [Escherichia ruysiae]|nr:MULTISPECIES: DUF1120 domain-containing protein [Escherichia]MBS5154503.1 DUF1120 domain-containing protein [Escherichia coli]MBY7187218.1 DUF1120 domain-containing protein [Escherichia ruysiae]MBY7367023.1 DUF1120 domain-containing protein [Escherichia coli]
MCSVLIALAMGSLSASAIAADATITVHGDLVPSGCSLGVVNGNDLDFGTQAVDRLTTASNPLDTLSSSLKIECPDDMFVGISTKHLNGGSEPKVQKLSDGSSLQATGPSGDVWPIASAPSTQINPLLLPNGDGAGVFRSQFSSPMVTTKANPTPTAQTLMYVQGSDFSKPWTESSSYISLQDGVRMVSAGVAGTATPMAIKTLTYQLDTRVTLLDQASFASVTSKQRYSGGFEVTLHYK